MISVNFGFSLCLYGLNACPAVVETLRIVNKFRVGATPPPYTSPFENHKWRGEKVAGVFRVFVFGFYSWTVHQEAIHEFRITNTQIKIAIPDP